DRLAKTMLQDPEGEMITAGTPLGDEIHRNDPNVVKVVLDQKKNALYFSRSLIPYHRDPHDSKSAVQPLLHLGVYGFRKDILKKYVRYRPSPLERCEKLEQLRALEHGIKIRVLSTSHRALGVDTPEDAKRIESYFHKTC
ncbi:MAG: 3-deoxy-manno-octulosonate cytidylyltransferase, partial [Verrucomicrobiota bacterium]